MKTRFMLCLGALGLASLGFAQKGQSDVTVPPTITYFGGFTVEASQTFIQNNVISVLGQTTISVTPPESIILFGLSVFANVGPREATTYPTTAKEQTAIDSLNTAIEAINGDLKLIHKQRVGLDVYNHLVEQNKKALKQCLIVAKSMRAESNPDDSKVANLTKIVDQLEQVGAYVSSVRVGLARI